MPGAHKIGAAISGPRITGGNFMDTRIFLNLAILVPEACRSLFNFQDGGAPCKSKACCSRGLVNSTACMLLLWPWCHSHAWMRRHEALSLFSRVMQGSQELVELNFKRANWKGQRHSFFEDFRRCSQIFADIRRFFLEFTTFGRRGCSQKTHRKLRNVAENRKTQQHYAESRLSH